MADYSYGDTDDTFCEPSTIGFPDMSQADPLGGFQNVPDAAFGGYGTGGETLHADGSVTTRHKRFGGMAGSGDGVADGGTP